VREGSTWLGDAIVSRIDPPRLSACATRICGWNLDRTEWDTPHHKSLLSHLMPSVTPHAIWDDSEAFGSETEA
jgi:hypothetical protein